MRLAIALAFLGLNFYIYYFLATKPVIPERQHFSEFPLQLGDWNCGARQRLDPKVVDNLGVTDYLICDFRRRQPAGVVSFYVGYHATQVREEGGGAAENSIHPPAHCLPGSGWDVIHSETIALEADGLPQSPASVKRLLIAKGEHRNLVYYWYHSRGRVIAEDWQKILFVGWDRATSGRTDGSLVRFTIPVVRGDEKRAERDFQDLAPRILTKLPAYVPG